MASMSTGRIRRIGLEDVVMADTEITKINGEASRLIYRGYDIENLADNATFEEVTYLLMFGELPSERELETFTDDLASRREIPDKSIRALETIAGHADPMTALRLGLQYVSAMDARPDEDNRDLHVERGKDIIAKMPTILASYVRMRDGQDPITPARDLGHAANFLYMMSGERPDEEIADYLDTCMIIPADHGINASTFTARVIGSTQSDIYSAITGAISAIKGPLHGGASGNVMELLESIDNPQDAIEYVDNMIDRGERIPGFGHRVYQNVDPRADVLRGISEELAEIRDEPKLFEIAKTIEEYVRNEVGFDTNLDFYSAVAYYYIGIPSDLFPLIFCLGRGAGWVSQTLEQYENNRLIRPRAEYIGPEELSYIDEK